MKFKIALSALSLGLASLSATGPAAAQAQPWLAPLQPGEPIRQEPFERALLLLEQLPEDARIALVLNPRVLRAFGTRGPSMVSLLNAMFAVGAILAPLGFVAIGSNPQLAFAVVAGSCALIWLVAKN